MLLSPVARSIEEPQYDVLTTLDAIEVRDYRPMIIAEVIVTAEQGKAISQGFRLLADYIFGENTNQTEIPMTAPVQQQRSTKIPMTAPVQQQAVTNPANDNKDTKDTPQQWRVSFVMPDTFTMETLPTPNNDQVVLKTIPQKRMAAIRFSGFRNEKNFEQHETQLREYLDQQNLEPISPPMFAYYDPPWVLPFMRRNEILLELPSAP